MYMLDFSKAILNASQDLNAVSDLVDSMYSSNFSKYFETAREMFARLNSKEHPITDNELNYVLIDLPVQLFDVSEQLSSFRMKLETLKLLLKQKERNLIKDAKEAGFGATEAKDFATVDTIEDRLLISAYSSVISRVESEISFSKELIMGAKKIWDARRKADASNPVSEVSAELPEYSIPGSSYIRGDIT